jgi:hypothetical protein
VSAGDRTLATSRLLAASRLATREPGADLDRLQAELARGP